MAFPGKATRIIRLKEARRAASAPRRPPYKARLLTVGKAGIPFNLHPIDETSAMPRHSPKAMTIADGDSSRTRILRATEQRIVRHGAHSVTIRLIEAESGLNSSLIGYYFGGIDGLLGELYNTNLDLMLQERSRLLTASLADGGAPATDDVLEAYLRSMWHEAAYCKGERALAVVHEIFSSANEAFRQQGREKMHGAFRPVVDALRRCLPQLDEATLLWRLCCLSGTMVSITPRASAWEMYGHVHGDPRAVAEETWLQQMMDFAKGALLAEPTKAPAKPRADRKPAARRVAAP